MVKKFVMVEFVSSKIKAIDVIEDLTFAVRVASLNLVLRHGIDISKPYAIDGKVIIKMEIPEEKAIDISIGRHLRGISNCLLKMNDRKYRNYVIGKRLLKYAELPCFGVVE